MYPCGTYLIQIYDIDLLYVARCKVYLKHYNLGSLSRELMSITKLYMDHKPGESLSLSAPELVHLSQQCVYGVGGGACIRYMWRSLGVKPPGLLEGLWLSTHSPPADCGLCIFRPEGPGCESLVVEQLITAVTPGGCRAPQKQELPRKEVQWALRSDGSGTQMRV